MADDSGQKADRAKLRVDLSGQVAIVTGASQGLGRAIAETLAANGATVAVVARSAGKLPLLAQTSAGAAKSAWPPAA